MQELEARFANARFARRHLSKVAGIGLAAVVAKLAMPKPVRAEEHCDPADPNCFLKGTRVRTAKGERAVEELAVGDLLPTQCNGIQPIQWVARYRFRRSDALRPWVRDVLPVRVARSALAAGVPHSDLYLSQQHAILTDGVLVRVGSLVNGATIALHDAGDVNELEYYNIKLQSHDIIDAEGALCETLLDVDENAVNFADYLRTYGAPSEPAPPCMPVLSAGRNKGKMRSHLRSALSPWVDRRQTVDLIRDRLAERALTMV